KGQDYQLALRYFQEARKLAPNAPEIYYDLGLAESKIAGREIRAICWFEAYLSANKNAANAAAVKDQIDELDVKSQSSISRLIQTVQDAASQIRPDSDNPDQFDRNLSNVAGLWAWAGNIHAALEIRRLLLDGHVAANGVSWFKAGQENGLLRYVAEIQAQSGDIAGAQQTANQITDGNIDNARERIVLAQAKDGQSYFAKDTIHQIKSLKYKAQALEDLGFFQAKAGDKAGTEETFKETLAIVTEAQKIEDTSIDVQVKNDAREAREAGQRAKDHLWESIAVTQLKAGDKVSAQKTVDQIQDANTKDRAQQEITNGHPAYEGFGVDEEPVISTNVWISMLDDTSIYSPYYPLNIDPFLDLAGYLKSQQSDDPQKYFEALRSTAFKIATTQSYIDRIMKRLAKQESKP
ncbi:MAG: hypothetical protein ACHQEM_13375, partial [Chitinophagales bacterium]